jgi:hypothetical protein
LPRYAAKKLRVSALARRACCCWAAYDCKRAHEERGRWRGTRHPRWRHRRRSLPHSLSWMPLPQALQRRAPGGPRGAVVAEFTLASLPRARRPAHVPTPSEAPRTRHWPTHRLKHCLGLRGRVTRKARRDVADAARARRVVAKRVGRHGSATACAYLMNASNWMCARGTASGSASSPRVTVREKRATTRPEPCFKGTCRLARSKSGSINWSLRLRNVQQQCGERPRDVTRTRRNRPRRRNSCRGRVPLANVRGDAAPATVGSPPFRRHVCCLALVPRRIFGK